MTEARRCSRRAGVLLAALLLAGWPAGGVLRADDKAALPADLNLVPRDAAGFVTVRVADLMQGRPGKQFLGQAPERMAEITNQLARELGLPLAEVERVTLVPRLEEGGVVLIVHTVQAYDRAALVRKLTPNVVETKRAGKAIYLDEKSRMGLFLVNEHVYARGPMQAVASMAAGEGEKGSLTDALALAAGKHQVVSAFQPALLVAAYMLPVSGPGEGAGIKATEADLPSASRAGSSPVPSTANPPPPHRPGGPPPPPPPGAQGVSPPPFEEMLRHLPRHLLPFKPLLEARLVTVVLDVADDVKADVRWDYANAEQAQDGETAFKTALYFVREFMDQGIHEAPMEPEMMVKLGRMMKQVQDALRHARVQTRDTVVEGTMRLPVDAALVSELGLLMRTSALRSQGANNLKQIGLAMLSFEGTFGFIPPAAICDPTGKPLLSWRVLILPYVEQEALYRQFHLNEPWDSEHNRKLLEKMPKLYAPVQGTTKVPHSTYYQVFTGPLTAFSHQPGQGPFGASARFPASFPDGTSNTLLVVEGAEAVPWTKPADLPFDLKPEELGKQVKRPLPPLGGQFADGFWALFADGSVHFIRKTISEETLRNLIMPADGNVIDWDEVEGRSRKPASAAPVAPKSESKSLNSIKPER